MFMVSTDHVIYISYLHISSAENVSNSFFFFYKSVLFDYAVYEHIN